ncbi:MAG: hypothetical protein ACYC1Z_09065 [Georgenia sp.]
MKNTASRKTLVGVTASLLLVATALAGCSAAGGTAGPTTTSTSAGAAGTPTATTAGVVLPVTSNPIVKTATEPTLEITYAAAEDNVDPATGKAITDRLELTLKNTGTTALDGFEAYYEMTDVTTGQKEAYYQKLDGVQLPAGQETTIYFDNETGPGHFPENRFSLYRGSTNEVDFAIQVSATGAKIATGTAVKAVGTGEQAD